ncbi:DUF2695 domain-containing protein [Pseudonocardia ailaonensis]
MNHSDLPDDPHSSWAGVLCTALGLPVEHVRLLGRWLAGALDARGCDGSLHKTRRWAHRRGLDPGPVVEGLLALGAPCDCAALDVLARS